MKGVDAVVEPHESLVIPGEVLAMIMDIVACADTLLDWLAESKDQEHIHFAMARYREARDRLRAQPVFPNGSNN